MNTQPESDSFGPLRRLLALKRNEQPPPGYFNRFSTEVVARLRAGDRADDQSVLAGILGESRWLQRVWSFLEGRPLVAGLFGATVCALFLSLLVYSEPRESNVATETTADALGSLASIGARPLSVGVADPVLSLSSTDPILMAQPAGLLLEDARKPQARPANWNVPGGN